MRERSQKVDSKLWRVKNHVGEVLGEKLFVAILYKSMERGVGVKSKMALRGDTSMYSGIRALGGRPAYNLGDLQKVRLIDAQAHFGAGIVGRRTLSKIAQLLKVVGTTKVHMRIVCTRAEIKQNRGSVDSVHQVGLFGGIISDALHVGGRSIKGSGLVTPVIGDDFNSFIYPQPMKLQVVPLSFCMTFSIFACLPSSQTRRQW